MTPLQAFIILFIIRMSAVIFTQTAFVPDEYWQSLEIAHHMAFGYGNITWEWQEGIRSYFYPSVIAGTYKILKCMELDSVGNLILVPRLMQALLSIASDYCFWLWMCKETGTTGAVALFSICTSWFWFYSCTRTLSNTLETSLTTIALYFFPWKGVKTSDTSKSVSFMWFVGLACVVRPTACVLWIPLCVYHMFSASSIKMNVLFQEYLPIGAVYVIISTLLDSYFYKQLVFSPFNFVYFNIIRNIGEFYGKHPAHWYLTSGLPVVLGAHLIPFIAGCVRCTTPAFSMHIRSMVVLMVSIVWTIAVYSCLSHKEFRFILPLLPMALFISTCWLMHFHRTSHRYIVTLLDMVLVLGAIIPTFYLCVVHQRGTLATMQELAVDAAEDPLHTDILFLMPCHSMPLYSHLHVNVSTRFLTCDPFHHLKRDEADEFYESPEMWLSMYYENKHSLPSHIVMYDVLYPRVMKFFSSRYYDVFSCIFHAHMVEGRIGQYIYILKHNLYNKTIAQR